MATQDDLTAEERVLLRWGNPLPPLAGADGADEGGDTGDDDAAAAAGADDTANDDASQDDGGKNEPDWKRESRKHERRAKESQARADAAEKRLKELEDADKTEHEKALEQARKEAADSARAEVTEKTRTRVLKAEIKELAAGKFADPEDAIKLLDLDQDDIFDDEGEVQTTALKEALDDLLERKPHLAAGSGSGGGAGDSDRGKGKGAGKDLEDMSVEEHFQRQRRHKD